MTLARTGVDDFDRFLASSGLQAHLYEMDQLQARREHQLPVHRTGEDQDRRYAQHIYEPQWLSRSFVRTIPDFALLTVMIIVFFVGAYVSFLRYDVR